MVANLTLAAFLGGLVVSLVFGFPLVCALLFGLVLFIAYARYMKIGVRNIAMLLAVGIKKSKNILMIFILIGFLTALWRACGTIPFIVFYGMKLIIPPFFMVSVFFLCCFVSFLMGTSFGTASTVGVICMIMARLNGASPVLVGGAVLSGIFFGDRCSPMSSSASLVASLTETKLYDNIRRMFLSCIVPFFLTCVLYQLLGGRAESSSGVSGLMDEFHQMFDLSWYVVIPAAVILILCMLKWDVKLVMAISAVLSFLLCLLVQHMEVREVISCMFVGFTPEGDSELVPLLSGGGLFSMINVGLIVLISSSYLGILEETGLLKNIQRILAGMSKKFGRFPAMCAAGIATSMFSCNQTLASMLTCELCRGEYDNKEELALDLEDSVIVLAALIPWSIAGSVPLATIGAGSMSFLFAFYLYLLPGWRILTEAIGKRRFKKGEKRDR